MSTWKYEQRYWESGVLQVAGVDEAGRGAWAGPVTVAAVILPAEPVALPYRDSKTLSAAQRSAWAEHVKDYAIAWHVDYASAAEVDQLGVLLATRTAALRAIAALTVQPTALITDFLQLNSPLPQISVAKADRDSFSVAAASLLAKTARDAYMCTLAQQYPQYGFDQHKGYGAEQHRKALSRFGICPEHRLSYAPVQRSSQVSLFGPE